MNEEWEGRLTAAWTRLDTLDVDEFRSLIDGLTADLGGGSAIGAFERASARDSTGSSDLAVPLYREALGIGLTGLRRRRASIQLASSLRNLGELGEAAALLEYERAAPDGDPTLADAVSAFLALVYTDLGRHHEAIGLALTALAAHLPRYQRSVAAYAAELTMAPS